MKLLVVLCIVGVAVSAPPTNKYSSDQEPKLLKYESENDGQGNYRFAYELTDGTRREEQGQLENECLEDEAIVVRGSYSYISPEGIRVNVIFIADDKGYQPKIQMGPGAVRQEVSSAGQPEVSSAERPEVPSAEQPEVPSAEHLQLPSAEQLEVPSAEHLEVPSAEHLEVPSAEQPEVPSAEQPEVPSAERPEVPSAEQPEAPPGVSPGITASLLG